MYLKLFFMKNYKLNFLNRFNLNKVKKHNVTLTNFLNRQKISNILFKYHYDFENNIVYYLQSYIINFVLNSYNLKTKAFFLKSTVSFKLNFKKRKKLFNYLGEIFLVKINTNNLNYNHFISKTLRYRKVFLSFFVNNITQNKVEWFLSNPTVKNFLTKAYIQFEMPTRKYDYFLKNFKLKR